jgi:uncharacterized cupin superfamily protein
MTAMTGLRPVRIDPGALQLEPLDLDPAAFQSPLPVQNYHLIFEDAAIGMAVGIWDTTTMQEAFGPYPGDEFITVLEGSFSILDADGNAVTGHTGQSATFRNGIPVSWKQEGYLRKIYLTLMAPGADTPVIASAAKGVTVLDGEPSSTGTGILRRVEFQNDACTMSVEHRIHTDQSLSAVASERHELCRILSGRMTLTDYSGEVLDLGAGDHVFIPKGAVVATKTADATQAYHVYVKA